MRYHTISGRAAGSRRQAIDSAGSQNLRSCKPRQRCNCPKASSTELSLDGQRLVRATLTCHVCLEIHGSKHPCGPVCAAMPALSLNAQTQATKYTDTSKAHTRLPGLARRWQFIRDFQLAASLKKSIDHCLWPEARELRCMGEQEGLGTWHLLLRKSC